MKINESMINKGVIAQNFSNITKSPEISAGFRKNSNLASQPNQRNFLMLPVESHKV